MEATLLEILSRQVSAREKLKEYLKSRSVFAVSNESLLKLTYGELPFGYLLNNSSAAIARLLRELDTRLIHIIGMPGTTKTNLLRLLCLYITAHGDKVTIISRKGYEFTPLLKHINNFYDLDHSQIRLNPFHSPSKEESQSVWQQSIAGAISSEGWLVYGSATHLDKTIEDFAKKNPNNLITPSKLISFLTQRRNYRLIQVEEKVRNRLEALTSGPGKQIFDTNEIIDFEFYASNNINFNLAALSSNQVSYFIAIFLQMLTTYKGHSHNEARHVLILDDYSDLLTEQTDTLPRINELLKTINVFGRKLNIDLWLVSQSLVNVSKYILDSATTLISFKIGSISDDLLTKTLNFNEREQGIVSALPKGYAVVSRRMASPRPFLVRTPLLPIQEINEQERDSIMKSRIEKMRSRYMTIVADSPTDTPGDNSLDTDEIHILKDIAISPYESLSERALKLSYSVSTLYRHVKSLKDKKYLQEIQITLGKGIGVIKLYKLEEKAISLTGKQQLVGRGSMIHGYWMHTIKKYYELNGNAG